MNLDVGAVQCKRHQFFSVNDLRLKILFDAVENAFVDPSPKTLIDGGPLPEVFGQGSPFAPVFGNVLQGLQKKEILYFHIATLNRQQVVDAVILFLRPFHKER